MVFEQTIRSREVEGSTNRKAFLEDLMSSWLKRLSINKLERRRKIDENSKLVG